MCLHKTKHRFLRLILQSSICVSAQVIDLEGMWFIVSGLCSLTVQEMQQCHTSWGGKAHLPLSLSLYCPHSVFVSVCVLTYLFFIILAKAWLLSTLKLCSAVFSSTAHFSLTYFAGKQQEHISL